MELASPPSPIAISVVSPSGIIRSHHLHHHLHSHHHVTPHSSSSSSPMSPSVASLIKAKTSSSVQQTHQPSSTGSLSSSSSLAASKTPPPNSSSLLPNHQSSPSSAMLQVNSSASKSRTTFFLVYRDEPNKKKQKIDYFFAFSLNIFSVQITNLNLKFRFSVKFLFSCSLTFLSHRHTAGCLQSNGSMLTHTDACIIRNIESCGYICSESVCKRESNSINIDIIIMVLFIAPARLVDQGVHTSTNVRYMLEVLWNELNLNAFFVMLSLCGWTWLSWTLNLEKLISLEKTKEYTNRGRLFRTNIRTHKKQVQVERKKKF